MHGETIKYNLKKFIVV